jgi:shikimate kinase
MAQTVRQALSPIQREHAAALTESPMADTAEYPSPQPAQATSAEPASAAAPRLLFLIGYRGAGKTTVGKLLAEKLGWDFVDADALLEQHAGRSIREIFAEEGEAGFRSREATLLEELCRLEEHVIATGGGVVLTEENRARLQHGSVVWLQAPADVLWQRLQVDPATSEQRPDLAQGGLAEIEELLAARIQLYEMCQQFTIDAAAETPEQIADTIVEWLQK